MKEDNLEKKNIDYKRLSTDFCKVWSEDVEKINKEFMDAIDTINFYALSHDKDLALKDDSYDLPVYYKSLSDAITAFNNLYHVVTITKGWKDKEIK